VDFDGYESILNGENLAAGKRAKMGRLLHLLVDRLFGEDDEDEALHEKNKRSRRHLISEIFAIIRASDEKSKKE
jgi:hypothetical protein